MSVDPILNAQPSLGPAGIAPQALRIAILPPRETERFTLANRASLTAWLRAKRITIIDSPTPEALKSATILLLADPSQCAMLAHCTKGTKILEITPAGWSSRAIRSQCAALGLRWTEFLATPPSYPILSPIPFGARVPLNYEIPIRGLSQILDQL